MKNLARDVEPPRRVKKFKYIEQENRLTFRSRTDITEISKVKAEALEDGVKFTKGCITWTGSSFDRFKLNTCNKASSFENLSEGQASHSYRLTFNTPLNRGDQAEWEVEASMKDTRRIMVPYYAQAVTANIEHLYMVLYAPKGLLKDVKKVVYADTMMTKELEVSNEPISPEMEGTLEKFIFDIPEPNLMYGYAIEWMFGELN